MATAIFSFLYAIIHLYGGFINNFMFFVLSLQEPTVTIITALGSLQFSKLRT